MSEGNCQKYKWAQGKTLELHNMLILTQHNIVN